MIRIHGIGQYGMWPVAINNQDLLENPIAGRIGAIDHWTGEWY